MPANLTRKTILLQSFETAALSSSSKRVAMKIPAAVNGAQGTSSNETIFRTTEK